MALDDEKQLVDRWLDAAMKEYGSVDADSALEQRLLQRLQAAPSPGGSARWQWQLVFATIAAVVLVIAWSNYQQTSLRRAKTSQHAMRNHSATAKVVTIPKASARPSTVASKNAPGKVRRHTLAEAKTQAWPAQFPTPRPLSQQEQLLAQYVREQPRQAQLVARARAELLREVLAEFEARDHDKKISSSFE